MNKHSTFSNFLKTFGPGLIFAGTSIGVSHVVQSTRAGANYGFALVWAVILINILKYPFFEFGPRYVAATGENLLQGYKRVGNWAFYLYLFFALCLMFPIQSAVTLVTTGLIANLLHWSFSPALLSAAILAICSFIVVLGKYPLLDKAMKAMVILLGVSTISAFAMAFIHGSEAKAEYATAFTWSFVDITFLIALMGWMPSTIDISVWHSFWSVERKKQTKHSPSVKEALTDFHIGYWATMFMAVFFLGLGALVMYGTGESFSPSAITFTGQVISLYTDALGSWSYPIIVTAAAVTMFSTTLCCYDAFPRVATEVATILWPEKAKRRREAISFWWMVFVAGGTILIIAQFANTMKTLVDFATIFSFLIAPVFAYLNLRAVTAEHVPQEARPSRGLVLFSWLGIIFLAGFSVLFIVWKFALN